eukprot:TRINITY_DN6839_c0_g1_i1.p1 TRINITY_DN6839_c0_g1~~TRINITY_DN6839_c0_g1_i1.p1  ORF type:complete len:100 (+),score=7.29 TRINITY_DN6839_c0_g1_i1:261-560(+)
MGPDNLGMIFGPLLLRFQGSTDIDRLINDTNAVSFLASYFISNHKSILNPDIGVGPQGWGIWLVSRVTSTEYWKASTWPQPRTLPVSYTHLTLPTTPYV